jgi:aldose 1-epimerase
MKTTLSLAALAALSAMSLAAATIINKSGFGKMPDGTPVSMYTMTAEGGVEAKVITYGGILVSLKTPDRKGALGDIVLGHDTLADYRADKGTYFGALVGRYANRIAKAAFTLNGVTYKLAKNDGENSLHGGLIGFNQRVWSAKEIAGGVELTLLSKDGEEGYPGNLKVVVTYVLTGKSLQVHYTATTDQTTVLNLTNHSYWNLRGEGDILEHQLTIHADRFTPVDAGLIPTGELKAVAGTPFDFRKARAVGARISENDPQLRLGHGYDHNWVLNRSRKGLEVAARVDDPSSGRFLEVLTDQPGVQFYTGNFLNGSVKGKGGKPANLHAALCLETQHFPDSPNRKSFPSSELKPGDKYETTTEFHFGTK